MTPAFWDIEDGQVKRNQVPMSATRREEIQKRIAEKFAKVEPPSFCRQCRSREAATGDLFCSNACREIYDRNEKRAKHQETYRPPQILVWLLIISIGLCVASFSSFCTKREPQPATLQPLKK